MRASPSARWRTPSCLGGSVAFRSTTGVSGNCTRSSSGGIVVYVAWDGRWLRPSKDEARRRGALTLTLGTDDDGGQTSVAGVDLYDDVPRHIAELHDLGSRHPFLFYRLLGYVVTGIMPDANGPGRPDIYMSKPARSEGGV